jgi:hypothetical protein
MSSGIVGDLHGKRCDAGLRDKEAGDPLDRLARRLIVIGGSQRRCTNDSNRDA